MVKKKILIIQTAFIGDVILATSLIEKLHQQHFETIDFLLRKGNEGLLVGHPFLNQVFIWDKNKNKYAGMLDVIKQIRKQKYDVVINLQRFLSTGIITIFSGAKMKVGFRKNPFSFLFSLRYPHEISTHGTMHETARNLQLISSLINDNSVSKPRLYPSVQDFSLTTEKQPYVTISPTSVWFTKQYPMQKWVDVMNMIHPAITIYLLGGNNDVRSCEVLKSESRHPKVEIKAGKLSFLQSAALVKNADMNFVNDSAPLHIASAMDAPVTAIFCSTVPAFGFGPLSTISKIAEISHLLYCRPCGLHGYKTCPEKHFKCSEIAPESIVEQSLRQ